MNSKLQLIISSFTLFIILNISSAGAAIFHDESIDGDLASPIIGTIMGDATFIGSLDGGTTSDLIDGPDESDVIIFRRKDIWSLDVDVIESVEIIQLSLASLSAGGLPNSVIIRDATPTVYANMLPGEYRLDLFPVDHIGSLNYQFTIRTSASIPEPSALILIGLGLIGLFGEYRKTAKKQKTYFAFQNSNKG